MELVERYEEDLALIRGWAAWLGLGGLLAALILAPMFMPGYYIYLANLVGIKILVAVGLNLLVGYTGQISLGHVGFYAIGAYAATHFSLAWGDLVLFQWFGGSFIFAIFAGGFVAAAFGYLIGLPALRLSGPYLAIVTLGFGIAVHQVLTNWEAISGGRMGLFVPSGSIGPLALTSDAAMYYAVWAFTVGLTLVAFNLTRSRVGRALVALRDSDIAAEMAGVNLRTYKTLAFALSAFYTGVAGALMAHVIGFLEPTMFILLESIYFLAMVVVGGLGTIPGSIFGGVLLTVMEFGLAGFQEYVPIVYGTVVVLIMALEPMGIYGRWLKIKLYMKTWPL